MDYLIKKIKLFDNKHNKINFIYKASIAYVCLILFLSSYIFLEAQNVSDDILIVGGDSDFPPYEFIDNKGNPAGYNVELMKDISKTMNLKIEFKLTSSEESKKSLQNGEIDVVPGMFYSEDDEDDFDYSEPHARIYHMIFIRDNNNDITTISDLQNKSIIITEGDVILDFLKDNNFTSNIIIVDSPEEALRLLASGKHDCAILLGTQGQYVVKIFKLSNVTVTGPPFYPVEYRIAVDEGNTELLNKLNEGLAISKNTGRQKQIYDKWIGRLLENGITAREVLTYFLIGFIPLLSIITGSLIWSWTLRNKVSEKTIELQKEVYEHKKAEEKIRELNSTLKLLNKILRHDIANNLTVTSMALEMMETKDLKLKDKALRSVNRSTDLIEQIRELESLVSDSKNFKPLDLNNIIHELITFYPIEISVEGNCIVMADDALSSVIDNIIRNAVVHGNTNKVDIKITCLDEFCEIRISDYGKGIPDEIKDKIFDEEFSYGDTAGTGLGLYIVKKVVDRYEGNINVENNPLQGTTFILKLKRAIIAQY